MCVRVCVYIGVTIEGTKNASNSTFSFLSFRRNKTWVVANVSLDIYHVYSFSLNDTDL